MNDTNVGVGMYYDSPDEKEIARLNARLEAERHAHRLAAADAERLQQELTGLRHIREVELARAEFFLRENGKLRAECEAAAAYVSVIPISVGLTPQTAAQYNAYIPYLTARTAK